VFQKQAGKRCSSCRYFESSPLNGQGWCQHPKVNGNGAALRLMVARELGCAHREPVLWGGVGSVNSVEITEEESEH
jgi:hypothetical protein